MVFQVSSNVACSAGNRSVRITGRPRRLRRSEPSASTTWQCAPIQLALPAAAGEIPGAGDAIAARDGGWRAWRWAVPRRRGCADRRRSCRATSGSRNGCDQGGAVGDEHVPGDRGIVAGELLDRQKVGPGLRLVAADGARQKHAAAAASHAAAPGAAPGCVAMLLDRIGRGGDGRAEIAGDGERVLAAVAVHARPHG